MTTFVNKQFSGGVANIRNIAQCYEAVSRTLARNPMLPGISAFYGPSGFGKSTAANYVATKTNAFYVQVKSTYTKKAFAQALLREMSSGQTIQWHQLGKYRAATLQSDIETPATHSSRHGMYYSELPTRFLTF
jgi:ABC-type lipoprotein export system ATPase subunit